MNGVVPYKYRELAEFFCGPVEIEVTESRKRGKTKKLKAIIKPTTNQFLIAIGRAYLEKYGPIRFWSALHRARREGYWAEYEIRDLPVKRKFGKSYLIKNVPQTVYKLEHELLEVRKALEELGVERSVSSEGQRLHERQNVLEQTISEKAQGKSEEELLAASEKWFSSLEAKLNDAH